MNMALEASVIPAASAIATRPRLIGNTLTLGTLAVMACLSIVFLAVNSSVYVGLSALVVTAVMGLVAIRHRAVRQTRRAAVVEQYADTVATQAVFPDRRQTMRQRRLRLVGSKLLEKCRAQYKPLTVALFDFGDLPELQAVFAGEVASDLGPTIAKKLKAIAPRRGLVMRTGPTAFMVLLPNFDAARTRETISATFGRACCVEFASGDHEMLLVPDFMPSGSSSRRTAWKCLAATWSSSAGCSTSACFAGR
jgi:GGDEF domain-containing protein